MKLVLDPYMQRHFSLPEIARITAEYGYDGIELSPRSDFLEWWVMPRATSQRIKDFKRAIREHGTDHLTLLPRNSRPSPL
mgnify:CR=1 FL=1